MSDDERRKWDQKYGVEEYIFGKEPSSLLVEHKPQFPPKGRALDIAAGEGQNAVYLAQHGFEVEAIDISAVGLRKAQSLAQQKGVSIKVRLWDIERSGLPAGVYEIILCLHYMQRDIANKITKSLAPGGLLFMELNTIDNLKFHKHPTRKFLVEKNELITWFPELSLVTYREGIVEGHAVAQLVARKPIED